MKYWEVLAERFDDKKCNVRFHYEKFENYREARKAFDDFPASPDGNGKYMGGYSVFLLRADGTSLDCK